MRLGLMAVAAFCGSLGMWPWRLFGTSDAEPKSPGAPRAPPTSIRGLARAMRVEIEAMERRLLRLGGDAGRRADPEAQAWQAFLEALELQAALAERDGEGQDDHLPSTEADGLPQQESTHGSEVDASEYRDMIADLAGVAAQSVKLLLDTTCFAWQCLAERIWLSAPAEQRLAPLPPIELSPEAREQLQGLLAPLQEAVAFAGPALNTTVEAFLERHPEHKRTLAGRDPALVLLLMVVLAHVVAREVASCLRIAQACFLAPVKGFRTALAFLISPCRRGVVRAPAEGRGELKAGWGRPRKPLGKQSLEHGEHATDNRSAVMRERAEKVADKARLQETIRYPSTCPSREAAMERGASWEGTGGYEGRPERNLESAVEDGHTCAAEVTPACSMDVAWEGHGSEGVRRDGHLKNASVRPSQSPHGGA